MMPEGFSVSLVALDTVTEVPDVAIQIDVQGNPVLVGDVEKLYLSAGNAGAIRYFGGTKRYGIPLYLESHNPRAKIWWIYESLPLMGYGTSKPFSWAFHRTDVARMTIADFVTYHGLGMLEKRFGGTTQPSGMTRDGWLGLLLNYLETESPCFPYIRAVVPVYDNAPDSEGIKTFALEAYNIVFLDESCICLDENGFSVVQERTLILSLPKKGGRIGERVVRNIEVQKPPEGLHLWIQ